MKGGEFRNQLLSRLNLQPVEQHMNGVMREGMKGGRRGRGGREGSTKLERDKEKEIKGGKQREQREGKKWMGE